MKYIKIFETFEIRTDKLFWVSIPSSYDDFADMTEKDRDSVKEIFNTLFTDNKFCLRFHVDMKKDFLEVYFRVDGKLRFDSYVMVYKLEDEYYFLKFPKEGFTCDGLEGIKKCLEEYLKNI